MLFSQPLSAIAFQDIESCCRAFQEGVRVEYKGDIAQVPKVISAFANTVGGVWIIGVRTDSANRPVFPLSGIPITPGLEERIVQSSLSGIYPPLAPQVKVVPLPDDPARCVVLVRVLESIEAPHAIENSTRIYVRTASVSQPFTLAQLDRIEFLLNRRNNPSQRRERLIALAEERSPYGSSLRLRVVVAPTYPRGPILDLEDIFQANERAVSHPAREDEYLVKLRRSNHALISSSKGGVSTHHFEVDDNGIIFFEQLLPCDSLRVGGESYQFIRLLELLVPTGAMIRLAQRWMSGRLTNLIARVHLFVNAGQRLLLRDDVVDKRWVLEDAYCVDKCIDAETSVVLETLDSGAYVDAVTQLLRQVGWAFNCTQVSADLVGYFLETNRLIKK